ncbi:MAG TPA: ABC transporter substrate-binding protein [Falsiroseomonas sp.]|jgi:peptide/nickel transport system substrate-binding protein|nr:ABC transporter substrate-binding protein [Falsiroseomonas sp.]
MHRRHLLTVTAAAAALPRFAIGQADSRPTITVAVQNISTSNTLEMLREQSNVGTRIFRNYVEPLVDTDWVGDMSLRPGLATGWRRVDDRVVEFDLREGVRFHDGNAFTADDVAFSFGPERMWGGGAREVPTPVVQAARRAFPGFERIEVLGAHRIRVVSKVPDVVLEGRMARTIAVIATRQAFLAAPSWMDWARRPVGTGPYRIAEFRPDQALVLDAFDDHWQGRPTVRRLRFAEIPEVASRVNMLFSGEAEFASDIPPDQIAQIESDRRFEVVGGPINNTRYLVFNKSHPVLADPLVRRAMSHSVDREAIVAALWGGRTSVPPGLQWEFYGEMYLRDIEVPRFNPAEARRLLREAGYRGQPIPYRCLDNYYTNQTATAQIMVEGWRAVGLNVQLQMVENWGQITGAEPETRGVHDWSAAAVVNDPSIQMSGTWGRAGAPWLRNQWRNEEFGALAAELETSVDRPRRILVWRRMLEIIEREDPGYVVLHRNANFTAKRRDIAWQPAQSFVMDFRGTNWGA